jgi:hypothetical protein
MYIHVMSSLPPIHRNREPFPLPRHDPARAATAAMPARHATRGSRALLAWGTAPA